MSLVSGATISSNRVAAAISAGQTTTAINQGIGIVSGSVTSNTYNSGAAQTETVPAGATSVTIELVGPGGNGANGNSAPPGGGGGGGGGYVLHTMPVVPGGTLTYTVGTISGVDTTVSSGTLSAPSLRAGSGTDGTSSAAGGAAGTGGVATGGLVNVNGTDGSPGSAGNGGAGGAGAAPLGGAGAPSPGTGSGTNGTAPGGGGSGAGSAGGSSGLTYPRLSWDVNGGSQNYSQSQASLIAFATHMDVMVIGGDFEGAAAASGYNRGTLVAAMQVGDGVGVPKVLQYNIADHFNTNNTSAPSPSGTPTWSTQINAKASTWFLWASGGGGTHVNNAFGGAGDYQTNPCALTGSTDPSGLEMEGAFAKYHDGLYRTGGTADAASTIDGPFHDNLGHTLLSPTGDYTHGVSGSTSGDNAANNLAYRTGQKKFIDWFRANAPSQFIMANCAWTYILSDDPTHRQYQRGTAGITPLNGVLNASMNESQIGAVSGSIEQYAGFEAFRGVCQFHEDQVLNPEYCIHQHISIDANGKDAQRTSTNGQALRYGFCGILCVANGTHTFFDPATKIAGNYYNAPRWFDYYTVDPATGVALDYATSTSGQVAAARRWLGGAAARITAPNLVDLTTGRTVGYIRIFTHAGTGKRRAVICNPSSQNNVGVPPTTGAIPVTFNLVSLLGGTWKRVTASSGTNVGFNATIDSGATANTNQTVAVADGQIFMET